MAVHSNGYFRLRRSRQIRERKVGGGHYQSSHEQFLEVWKVQKNSQNGSEKCKPFLYMGVKKQTFSEISCEKFKLFLNMGVKKSNLFSEWV